MFRKVAYGKDPGSALMQTSRPKTDQYIVARAGHGVCFGTDIDQIQHRQSAGPRGSRNSSQRSRIVVYAAAGANLAIAAVKFIVAGASGSSSLLSEGFHSLADCGNELLILIGIGR